MNTYSTLHIYVFVQSVTLKYSLEMPDWVIHAIAKEYKMDSNIKVILSSVGLWYARAHELLILTLIMLEEWIRFLYNIKYIPISLNVTKYTNIRNKVNIKLTKTTNF